MQEFNLKVNFEKNIIYNKGDKYLKNLVQNDYNSTKLKFEFDSEFKRALFKLMCNNNLICIKEIENNEVILEQGMLNQNGNYQFEISIYDDNSRFTNFATYNFNVRRELANSDEITEPDDRLPILDSLINEVNEDKNYIDELKNDVEDYNKRITDNTKRVKRLESDIFDYASASGSLINISDSTLAEIKEIRIDGSKEQSGGGYLVLAPIVLKKLKS